MANTFFDKRVDNRNTITEKKASKEDINQISDQLNSIIKERREKAKSQFSVGDIVRIIGYTINGASGSNDPPIVYFNPDNTWVEIA